MKEQTIKIGRVEIPVKEQEFADCNILSVKAGTSGWTVRGSKWDCRTLFSVKNEGCTVMRANVDTDMMGYTDKVDIYFEGETELVTFICGLKFALDTLLEQAKATIPDFDLERAYKDRTGEFLPPVEEILPIDEDIK